MTRLQPVLPLLFDTERHSKIRKRVRQVSRENHRRLAAIHEQARKAGRETRTAAAMRIVAAFWNRFQRSGTCQEVFAFAKERGEPWPDIRAFAPRITALVAGGIVEYGTARRCSITGAVARTIRIREAGSKELP